MSILLSDIFHLLILVILCTFTSCICPFPKTIWMYWNQPQPSLPLIPRLCYKQILKYAQQSQFNVVLLHEKNLHKQIVQKSKNNYQANYADFIRLTILEQHGGIWIDITTILTESLQWLNNLQSQKKYLSNKYGDSIHDPDALIFYNPLYGYRLQQDNQYQYNFNNINQLPGYQSWFIGAKKNASIINKWRNKFIQYYLSQYQQIAYDFTSKQIYISHLGSSSYFRVFYAIYYVIQQKQKQLDRQLDLFSLTNQRKNANVQFKVWGLNCRLGPCLTYMGFLGVWGQMSRNTLYEISLMHNPIRYFAKLQHGSSSNSKIVIEQQIALHRQNITLKQSFQRQPWYESCTQINYIVENSVLSKLAEISPDENIKIQTIEERNKWKEYCEQLQHKKNHNKIIKKYLYEYLQYLVIILIIWNLCRQTTSSVQLFRQSNKTIKQLQQQIQTYNNNIAINLSLSIFQKIMLLHLSNIILLIFSYISIRFSIYLDYRNIKNQLFRSYILTTIYLFLDYMVIKNQQYIKYEVVYFNNKSKSLNVYMTIINQIRKVNQYLRYFGYIAIAKICLNLIQNRQENMILYSIWLGLVGPAVMDMSYGLMRYNQRININNNKFNYFNSLIYLIKGKPRILIILMLSLFNLFPHSLYIINESSQIYLMHNLIYISIILITLIMVLIIVQLLILKNPVNVSVQYLQLKQSYKKKLILILLSLNGIWLYSYVYKYRLINQYIRWNFQVMYVIIYIVALSGKNITKYDGQDKKLAKVEQNYNYNININNININNINTIKISNISYHLPLIFEDISLIFLIIINLLTPYQHYHNQYNPLSDQSSKLVDLINSFVALYVVKIWYICFIYINIQLIRKIIKVIKCNQC